MAIRIMSDLHLEFGGLQLPITEGQEDDILVLAGDIGLAKRPGTYYPFIEATAPHFRKIIYIMGNHEHYHGSVDRSYDKIKKDLEEFSNVHVLDNEVLRVDDVSFVCSTMWASFDKGNPMTFMAAGDVMNDHRIIRTGPPGIEYKERFRPEHAYKLFREAVQFIFPAIMKEKEAGQKVCVVTHHAPSPRSIPKIFRGDPLNGAYASVLDDKILDTSPNVWIHGHTHTSFLYEIGNTTVVCNPRGYYGREENPDFDLGLRLSLDQ